MARSEPAVQRKPASSNVPLPLSFVSGRYDVHGFLGEGGRKRVYLAKDTKLERDVAFALIKTEGLDADGLIRVRREAQAMARLGDHPHIVTVYDIGDEEGQPYIVSQYMAGGDVDGLLGASPNRQLAVEQALLIAEQVCSGLEHAHAHEIIHRDLKPGNVWLTAGGTAKIGDFGLAVALDRTRLTAQGMMIGTAAYMSPEQALGRQTDARSDLYALGCILYESLTGRPPFLGEDTVAVISQHINTAPVSPAWHRQGCPRAVDTLIMRLLAKSPQERPQSATEVVTEIRRILNSVSQMSVVEQTPAVTPAAELQGVAWGGFVGRQDEMRQLKASLDKMLSGQGSLIMLVGEPGIGKTRLAQEFAVYAGLRGVQVLSGRCYEGDATVPYLSWVEALRQYARGRDDEALRDDLGESAPELASLVSEIRQRFPDISEPPTLEGDAGRLRVFDSVAAFFGGISVEAPLLVFLDDIHWADKPSLLLLQHLARGVNKQRVMLLAAYRDIELDRTHPLAETIASLRREHGYERVLLRGLPVEDILAFIEALSEEATDEQNRAPREVLAAALHRETEGNPFFIREVISHLVEEGRIYRDEQGRWTAGAITNISELGIPEGVREVIGRRLSRLSDGCNQMLTLASTMTGGFSWDALKAISPEDEAKLLDLLDEALRAQLIHERRSDQAGTYDFTHALIRQTLYEELSTPRRVLLHRQIGLALDRLYEANPEPHLAELAHHFFQSAPGGDIDKAIDYCRRAGDRAIDLLAYEDAVGHYERSLQALDLKPSPDPALRLGILRRLGAAQMRSGDTTESRRVGKQTLELARQQNDSEQAAEAVLMIAGAVEPGFLDPEVVGLLEEALEWLPEEDSGLRSRVMSRLRLSLAGLGQEERRTALGQEALDMARRVGDPDALLMALGQGVLLDWGHRTTEEVLAVADEMLAVADRLRVRELKLYGLWIRWGAYLEAGDLIAADREYAAFSEQVAKFRQPIFVWFAELEHGMKALLEGRWADAEGLAQKALAVGTVAYGQFAFGMFGVQMFPLRREQGRLAELEPAVYAYGAQFPALWAWSAAAGYMDCELGRPDKARAVLEKFKPDLDSLSQDFVWLIGMALLSEIAWNVGDADAAERLYNLLFPYNAKNVVIATNCHCYGAASRFLGLLATVLERWDVAEEHFAYAIEMNGRISPPWLAWTQFQYADMLVKRAGPDDRQRAMGLIAEALDIAGRLHMKALLDRALGFRLKMLGIDTTKMSNSIEAVASAVYAEQPDFRSHAAPDGTVTIMFSDIERSTEIMERLGDQAFVGVLREHNAIVRRCVAENGGFEVKSEGDGFMIAFQSARRALDCAISMQRAFAERRARDEVPVSVRIGLHCGETIKDGDDFFGRNVILAARVADQAKGGEILVSGLLKALVDSTGDFEFGSWRTLELKGLSGMYEVWSVSWPLS